MLAPKQQMLAPAGLRVHKCVRHRSPMSVSGRLEKENTRRRVQTKVDENEMLNPESRSRGRSAEVRKTGHYLDPEWMLGIMSYFLFRGNQSKKLG